MTLTVQDVEAALRRLRKQRREIMELRAKTRDPKHIEHLHRMMESLQESEKRRLDVLRRVKAGEKID